MYEYLERTSLPYNRNKHDKSRMIYESISISKSSIEDLCGKEDLKPYSCFLSATIITLTKYANNADISILTKINSSEVPLIVNDENRNETVDDYIKNIEKHLKYQTKDNEKNKLENTINQVNNQTKHDENNEFHFNFIYGEDNGNIEGKHTTLLVRESPRFYSLELRFDECKYTQVSQNYGLMN